MKLISGYFIGAGVVSIIVAPIIENSLYGFGGIVMLIGGIILLILSSKKKKDANVSNQVHSHQDERARSRKVDIISNEITDHASQSKSNKRDMGNPDDTNVSRGKEK